jgi:hypothetical protein
MRWDSRGFYADLPIPIFSNLFEQFFRWENQLTGTVNFCNFTAREKGTPDPAIRTRIIVRFKFRTGSSIDKL